MEDLIFPGTLEWEVFLAWAVAEGWRVPQLELDLLRGPLAGSAHCLRRAGACCGLVTAVAYERSGWIGNLLVPAARRGQGCGSRLFDHALQTLLDKGMSTVWLTASELGRPLYERRGFVAVDRIVRYVYRTDRSGEPQAGAVAQAKEMLLAADLAVWQESRKGMLGYLARTGPWLQVGGACALLQRGGEVQVLGPWYGAAAAGDDHLGLLRQAQGLAVGGVDLVCDLRAGSLVAPVLESVGFRARGETLLMARGAPAPPSLADLVSLASLGSFG